MITLKGDKNINSSIAKLWYSLPANKKRKMVPTCNKIRYRYGIGTHLRLYA